MTMTFNEFQRELKKRLNDPQQAYLFSLMYEYLIALNQQLDELAALTLNLTEQQQRFVEFNTTLEGQLKNLRRRGDTDIGSVSPDPDTEH